MNTIKLKINNSYESEPSSSNASSGNESHYEHQNYEEQESKLPYLLQPRAQCPTSVEYFSTRLNQHATYTILGSQGNFDQSDLIEPETEKKRRRGQAVYSSQESDFEGFTQSQLLQYQEQIQWISSQNYNSYFLQNKSDYKTEDPVETIQTGNYYEQMIEENSCNAVDMEIPVIKDNVERWPRKVSVTEDLSEFLTFNGKFKKRTESEVSYTNEEPAKEPLKPLLNVVANSSLKYQNERSPDLFGDYDDDDNGNGGNEEETSKIKTIAAPLEIELQQDELNDTVDDTDCINFSVRREKELLKRIQMSLSGVPPPPSLTIPQLNMFNVILQNKEKILNFNTMNVNSDDFQHQSLFKPSHTLKECHAMEWKDIYNVNQHGVSYNVSKTSEKIEMLSLSVIERFIGAETTSSFQVSPSSAKKRSMRLKMLTQSPGSRLSHLAKRRSIFSSANLQSNSQKVVPSGGRQIMLDSKKGKQKRKGTTPKRRTPGSRKKIVRKTPSSSARKRLFFRTDIPVHPKPGPSRETSKRALFQSPPKQVQRVTVLKPIIKPELADRVEKSKRALFSPDKCSQSSSSCFGDSSQMALSQQSSVFGGSLENLMKRKRNTNQCEEDEDDIENNSKIFRSDNLTPRALKIKSQSFCIGAGTRVGGTQTGSNGKLMRASSDTTFQSSQLTENHRKKLLWAVSQALQAKQISVTHPKFKQYASVLARVLKRIFLEFHQKSGTSTSETMLRLAKKYVYVVMAGRSADEIYLYAKSKLETEKTTSSTKLSGYIGTEDYEHRKSLLKKSASCAFNSENSIDSFSFSQSFMTSQPNYSETPECSNRLSSQEHSVSVASQPNMNSAIKLSIQPNKSLQNSSSKNNFGFSALRENIDCERRSGQKNFTGKDQRNMSPYSTEKSRSGVKAAAASSSCHMSGFSDGIKAKRQISFDN